jgi:hypothetical protein
VLPVAVWLVALALVCLALTVQQLLADL